MRPNIREMKLTDYMCQEKKEEEVSPALKTVWKHRYEDSKTTLKEQWKTFPNYGDKKQCTQHNNQ